MRKIDRAFGIHILLILRSVLAGAFGAWNLTNLYFDLKHKVPNSFRQVSVLVKRKQKQGKVRDFETGWTYPVIGISYQNICHKNDRTHI